MTPSEPSALSVTIQKAILVGYACFPSSTSPILFGSNLPSKFRFARSMLHYEAFQYFGRLVFYFFGREISRKHQINARTNATQTGVIILSAPSSLPPVAVPIPPSILKQPAWQTRARNAHIRQIALTRSRSRTNVANKKNIKAIANQPYKTASMYNVSFIMVL